MKLLTLLILTLSFVSRPAAGTPEATYGGKGLNVELVSEVTAVRPGEPFYAGLFIHHDGGSHTYWKNPGLAGVATRLEWSLPPEWQAGEIEWPAPEKVKMAAINTHGYERDVLLMVKITPPKAWTGSAIELKTMAAWMCCARTCHPGYCHLSLNLPVKAGSGPEWNARWHPVFEQERRNIPGVISGWKLTARRNGKHIVLSGEAEKPGIALPANPVFMSEDNLICSHPDQVWKPTKTGFEATLEVSDLPPAEQKRLRGLLAGKPGWLPDDPRAVTIDVPVE